jgi:hypothetical protein
MPLTVEDILRETAGWPSERKGELITRLQAEEDCSMKMDPDVEAAWKTAVRERLDDLRSGRVQGIPGEEVLERMRRLGQ